MIIVVIDERIIWWIKTRVGTVYDQNIAAKYLHIPLLRVVDDKIFG